MTGSFRGTRILSEPMVEGLGFCDVVPSHHHSPELAKCVPNHDSGDNYGVGGGGGGGGV